MANEFVAELRPIDFFREASAGYNPWSSSMLSGDLRGLRLNKIDTCAYNAVFVIPGSLTMATGLTLTFMVVNCEPPEYADELGKVLRLGVTFKRMADAESTDIDTGAATEQTKDITLDATAGNVDVSTLAVGTANLDSAVVGDAVAVRIRRIGSASQDTLKGSANLLYVG